VERRAAWLNAPVPRLTLRKAQFSAKPAQVLDGSGDASLIQRGD
jgi:hypothetical protein